MADLIIKPNSATGDKLILQDRAGGAVLTTADSGATIANATLTSPTLTTPALGTVTAGNLSNTAIVFPAGHIIKVTTHVSNNALSTGAAGLVAEADANDVHVTCVAGNKLNITIMGGSCLSLGTTQGWYSIGMRIIDNSVTTDVHISSLYNRALDDYKNDGMPCMMYTHTSASTSVVIKRFIEAHGAFDAGWYITETSGARYLIMEEQV